MLRARGVVFVGPAEGELAEGESGPGRMAEPEDIVEAVEQELAGASGVLAGRRVLVSAGGTREQLDAVRFLGNRSSGRMGVAVAEEARRRGAEVTLLAANLAVPAPFGVTVVDTPTAADLEREALARGGRGRHRHGRRGRRLPAGRTGDGEAPEGRRSLDGRARRRRPTSSRRWEPAERRSR